RETWIRSEQGRAQAPMQRARDALRRAGLADRNILDEFISIVHDADIAQNLLDAAHELGCQVIVVAREAFPWYREQHPLDVGERLQRDAGDGMAIAIVEPGDSVPLEHGRGQGE